MTVAAIVTLGYHGGTKYIATLGYTTEQLSYAVVDTFLPERRRIKKEWEERRLREIEREREKNFVPIEIPKKIINYDALTQAMLAGRELERDDEDAILLLM